MLFVLIGPPPGVPPMMFRPPPLRGGPPGAPPRMLPPGPPPGRPQGLPPGPPPGLPPNLQIPGQRMPPAPPGNIFFTLIFIYLITRSNENSSKKHSILTYNIVDFSNIDYRSIFRWESLMTIPDIWPIL